MANIKVPETQQEAINLVVNALINRNNHETMHDGDNLVHLNALHELFKKSSNSQLADKSVFKSIVSEGASSFCMMGFVPTLSYHVDMNTMTLIIIVDDPAASDR